jgi:hypothetical protein
VLGWHVILLFDLEIPQVLARFSLPALALLLVVLLFARRLHLLRRTHLAERKQSAEFLGRLQEDMTNLEKEQKRPKS